MESFPIPRIINKHPRKILDQVYDRHVDWKSRKIRHSRAIR